MASEAGKLIALSLGKIADSRKQRGGINLCKNLLVSTVLFKARSIYMMENYQQIADAKRQKKEVKCVQKSPEKVREIKLDTQPENVEAGDLSVHSACDLNTSSRIPEIADKENIVPNNASLNSQTITNDSKENMETTSQEKDNIPKSDEKLSEIRENAQSCLKCTKRRRTEVGENNESTELKSQGGESGPIKRVKTESPPTCTTNTSITKNNESKPEPMITEPPQISNLVQIFNTGFAGLCEQSNNSKDSYSAQSCVKQIASFVESLSRPVIALAV